MRYRKMGSLGWDVSSLGFGAMRLPKRRFNRVLADKKASISIIRHAIDLGINYIDTAWLYHLGNGEKIVGEALKGGYREKVKLVTKLPMFLVNKEDDFDGYLSKQLNRLGVDHLDAYLFHALNKGTFEKLKRFNFIRKMEKARDRGLLSHIGFSFHDTYPVFKQIIDCYNWDIAQIQYNYMDTCFQAKTEGLEYAYSRDIAVVIMEPLRGGRLVNPPAEALEVMNSAKNKKSPIEWALQFLWNKKEVATVLSGMGSIDMVDENCGIADRSGIGMLTSDDEKIIEKLADVYRKKTPIPCTGCAYCMPCPQGVDIPQDFALLNNLSMEKNGYFAWLIKRSYKKGNAALCTECKKCLEKCPQDIAIPDELKKVHSILGGRGRISDYYS